MESLFSKYSSIILFLHIISVVVWLGGMIVIRFSVHYSFLKIDDAKTRLERTLENLKKFFNMVIVSIIFIYITAIIMHTSLDFKSADLNHIAIFKELILLIMTIIFIVIFIKRYQAAKLFDKVEYVLAKKRLEPISKYLIPINIFLGVIEIFLGITLRGF